MAEARAEQDDDNMPRDAREPVVRRPPSSSGGRPDRRKPDHRHSQGPLSSIRAAIKRTSTRSTSLSETPRDRERDRDRDRDRDRERRRPEITILSAEPLASTSWFPGASGGFPPPPPPAAQIWGPTIPPSIQPPPSYEEVIREKSQEQVPLPSSSSSLSPSRPVSTTTIATQTDSGSSSADPHNSPVRRPVRPARPPLPQPPKSSHLDDITVAASQSALSSAEGDAVELGSCDLLSDFCSPLTSSSAAQTDQWDHPSERPKPRPRSKLGIQPISSEVKVQTLVKLREDGLATLASRASTDGSNQDVSQGKYLQELLDAFSSDDWGFPDRRSDSSSLGQSESEEEEEEEEEDMATLRARIQAFEQQQAAEGDAQTVDGFAKRPEPRPRPRLQGQPAKPGPPAIAPKPKHYPHGPKPSSKVFWEDGGPTAEPGEDKTETPSADLTSRPGPGSEPQTCRTPDKPSISPKPPSVPESPSPGPVPAPVPAPRPPPPKLSSSLSDSRVPPRPPVAPRASVGAPPPERSTADGHTTPTLPPRPSVEVGGGAQSETTAGTEATQNTTNQTIKAGSVRPLVPTKPSSLNSARRSSAPNLAPKPTGSSPTQPDPGKPSAVPVPAPTPPGPTKPPTPNQNQTPAPALRKVQTKAEISSSPTSSEPPLPPRPSSVKLLPLRPPPIKSIPGRPPPPTVSSASSSNQIPPPKAAPAASVSPANQFPPSHTILPSATVPAIQTQRAPKKGPPLPPRPKPGHPLFSSYMKQEVLIVLDDPSPSESQTVSSPVISPPQCLLDLDPQPEPGLDQDQSKPALEGLSDSQSILPVEQKELPEPATVSGPRCVAVFDYEGEEEDELTFSQGDIIALLQLIGQEWGRGQIHGRIGIFPLNFTEVVEPLPQLSPAETKPASTETGAMESSAAPNNSETPQSERKQTEEWAVALFDFPGQTAEDLSFQKGTLIQVMQHVDAEWCRGRLEGREGLYPAAFTQPCSAQPITGQQAVVKAEAKALFDFTAESEDELTLKVGDVISQVESVDDQWILGVVGGKRGIVPKNYISFL